MALSHSAVTFTYTTCAACDIRFVLAGGYGGGSPEEDWMIKELRGAGWYVPDAGERPLCPECYRKFLAAVASDGGIRGALGADR